MTGSGPVASVRQGGRAALERAVRRYSAAPLADRVFIRARARLAALLALEAHVPPGGRIVELGCGRGLFSNLLVESSPGREVVGIDPDPRRLSVARLTARPGLTFELADARDAQLPACDAVVMVDILYLLTGDDQARVIAMASGALRPLGRLVVYAQERRADPRFWLGYVQELIATGSGLTRGHGLHYSTREAMRERIQRCGLDVAVFPLGGRAYTDAIYVGVKPLS